MSLPKVSVVIPTHNRSSSLARLLYSLERLRMKEDFEVVVVDDCSTDDTSRIADRWCGQDRGFEASYLRLKSNGGPAIARNFGVQAALGEFVAFTDDDCVVHPEWLSSLMGGIKPPSRIVGVGGRVLPQRNDVFSQYNSFYRILEPPPNLAYLVTANCAYSRDAVIKAGGFEADISNPGGEDVGLSFRLISEGYRFAFAEDAIVYHDFRNNPLDFIRTFRNYGEGCRLVTERYFGNKGQEDD